jgi:hypothetical protein
LPPVPPQPKSCRRNGKFNATISCTPRRLIHIEVRDEFTRKVASTSTLERF